MNRRIIFFIIIILLNIILCSCGSSNEIDKLAIAAAIGIDKAENGYRVTAQIIIPSEISSRYSKGQSPITVYTATATTIFEAFRRMSRETSRKIYVSHIQVLVFGEEVARDGINKVIDFISREHEFRTDFYVLVAKNNTAYNILNTLTPIEKVPANHIHEFVGVSRKIWGTTTDVQLDELVRILSLEGQSLVLAGVLELGDEKKGEEAKSLEKTSPPNVLRLQYIAAFKKDKLIGWLDEDESKGYSYIVGKIEGTVESLEGLGEGIIAIEVKKTKSKIKAEISDGAPVINVNIKVEANIEELQIQTDLANVDSINKIEKLAEEKIEYLCKSSIKKAQNELKTDIFGFGEAIHRTYPKIWRELKEDWSNEFDSIPVKITVNVDIKETGTIINLPTKEEME
ncbi:Ger(x)C family spore germination protein [Proteiniborus sp.]|uniref:Ger(x)C family spore germination protein n=1 Tax=Proteiniborus sp. TaxID=2079015 RepID=UPI0033176341